jgi:hypothetical protein
MRRADRDGAGRRFGVLSPLKAPGERLAEADHSEFDAKKAQAEQDCPGQQGDLFGGPEVAENRAVAELLPEINGIAGAAQRPDDADREQLAQHAARRPRQQHEDRNGPDIGQAIPGDQLRARRFVGSESRDDAPRRKHDQRGQRQGRRPPILEESLDRPALFRGGPACRKEPIGDDAADLADPPDGENERQGRKGEGRRSQGRARRFAERRPGESQGKEAVELLLESEAPGMADIPVAGRAGRGRIAQIEGRADDVFGGDVDEAGKAQRRQRAKIERQRRRDSEKAPRIEGGGGKAAGRRDLPQRGQTDDIDAVMAPPRA